VVPSLAFKSTSVGRVPHDHPLAKAKSVIECLEVFNAEAGPSRAERRYRGSAVWLVLAREEHHDGIEYGQGKGKGKWKEMGVWVLLSGEQQGSSKDKGKAGREGGVDLGGDVDMGERRDVEEERATGWDVVQSVGLHRYDGKEVSRLRRPPFAVHLVLKWRLASRQCYNPA
jgi:hypothetical protein